MSAGSRTWPWLAADPLILASGSATRAAMLRAVGVASEQVRPDVDERLIEAPLRAAGCNAADCALALARAKALAVSAANRGRLVLGADQTLAAANHPGVKARDRNEAAAFLRALSGRDHWLHSAAAVARDGVILFECVETARLCMRALSDAYIAAYLDRTEDESLSSVGGYRIEEIGAQLFDKVEGDHNVILGLPLFPLLSFLRRIGSLA